MALAEIPEVTFADSSTLLEEAEFMRADVVSFASVPHGGTEHEARQCELEGRLQGLLLLMEQVQVVGVGLQSNLRATAQPGSAYEGLMTDFLRPQTIANGMRVVDIPQTSINSVSALPMPHGNTKNDAQEGAFRPVIDLRVTTSADRKTSIFTTSDEGIELTEQESLGRWYRLPLAHIQFIETSRND